MGKLDNGFDMTKFDADTRQTKRNVGSISLATGSGVPFAIPKTGFLAKVWVMADITQTITLGGGTAVVDPILGIYGVMSRVVLALGGSKTIYNLSGVAGSIVQANQYDAFVAEESALLVSPAHSAKVYAAGVAAGANTWRIPLLIPVTPNDTEMSGGFLNMYESLQSTLTLTMPGALYSLTAGVGPVLTTGAATAVATSGQFNIAIESFEIPKNPAARPPVNFLHILTESQKGITGAGDMDILHPISNVYLQIIHQVVHNAAANSLFVDNVRLIGQQSRYWYDLSQQFSLTDARYRNKRDQREGVFVTDLFYQGETGNGGWRDVFDGKSVTEFKSVITLNSGITLGTNPYVRTILRQLEPIQVDG